nr:DUF2213 domain-containing protein [Salmonella enterica]
MIITEMLAFDRASVRQFDKVGRLQIERSNLSKANVCGYFGHEIPGAEALGLDPQKLYQLYRDPDELRKAVSTFNNIPVLCRHKPDYPGAPAREYRVGTTHANSEFDGTYLVNGMSIWDNSAIAGIETDEQREISSSYAYVADMTPGTTPDVNRMTALCGISWESCGAGRRWPGGAGLSCYGLSPSGAKTHETE